MSETTKGLKIVFDADYSSFKKQLNGANKEIRATQNEAKALKESLQIEWNAEKFKKAQEVAQKAITDTEQKAEILRRRLKAMEEVGITDKNTIEYKNLQAELAKTEVSAQKLEKELQSINNLKMDKLVGQFDKVGEGLTKAGRAIAPISALAAATTAAIGVNTLKTVEYADELATVAEQLGISAEELQKFRYIAMQTDVSNEKLTQGFVKLRSTIGEALTGQVNYGTQALQALGFSIEDLKGKSADDIFNEVISQLALVEDNTLRATYANQIFGERVANDLIPLLKVGGDGLKNLSEEFEALGYMSEEDVKKLAEMDNTLNRIKLAFGNISREIGIAFLPLFEKIAEFTENRIVPAFQKFAEWIDELSLVQKGLIVGIGTFVATLAPLLLIGGKLSSSIGGLVGTFGKLSPALQSALGPIGIILGAFALLYSTNEEFRNSINELVGTLISSLMPIINALIPIVNELFNALMPIVDIFGKTLSVAIKALVPVIQTLFEVLNPLLTNLLGPISVALGIIGDIISYVSGILTPLIEVMNVLLKPALEFLLAPLKAVADVINGIVEALKWLGDRVGDLWNWVKGIFGGNEQSEVTNGAEASIPTSVNNTVSQESNYQETIQKTITNVNNTVPTVNTTNDYSSKTFNVNLTIQNFGAELDIENIAEQINLRLAEQF